MIRKIQIDFEIAVELTTEEQKELVGFVKRIVKRHEPPGYVYWVFGIGSLTKWSQADAEFLGKPVDLTAPISGEPQFDDEVFSIATACRER